MAYRKPSDLGGPNGIRTRVSTLRGSHPWPLDDGTAGAPGFEPGLPEPESGALPGYATPQRTAMLLAVETPGKDFSFRGARGQQRSAGAARCARAPAARSTRTRAERSGFLRPPRAPAATHLFASGPFRRPTPSARRGSLPRSTARSTRGSSRSRRARLLVLV